MKTPVPRKGSYYGMGIVNSEGKEGTWLEGEEFAYPNGGYTRRAYCKFPDGSFHVVKCSISDTYFSIPARYRTKGKTINGYITSDNGVLIFNLYKEES